jgi:hypothetical protein
MAGTFINCRRDGAPSVAGRLFDYLAGRFSHDDLFIDGKVKHTAEQQ